MSDIVLSPTRIERIQLAFRVYWLSPFCTGTILLGEPLISWALEANMLATKAYADAYDIHQKIAYQIKTGLPSSPVTFARLTTSSQFQLVNSKDPQDIAILGHELLHWVRNRIQEPITILGAEEVRIARLLYTKFGDFTYYERLSDSSQFLPENYTFGWSERGNALEVYRNQRKWFSWYPQGRYSTKNQNQLHFHGVNYLMPEIGASNRVDFQLGEPAQIPFDQMVQALLPLVQDKR